MAENRHPLFFQTLNFLVQLLYFLFVLVFLLVQFAYLLPVLFRLTFCRVIVCLYTADPISLGNHGGSGLRWSGSPAP